MFAQRLTMVETTAQINTTPHDISKRKYQR